MELGFPEEFFSEVVFNETQRALEAVGDDQRVVAWVSTGRSPHGGEAMTARDLHGILKASERAGLQRCKNLAYLHGNGRSPGSSKYFTAERRDSHL